MDARRAAGNRRHLLGDLPVGVGEECPADGHLGAALAPPGGEPLVPQEEAEVRRTGQRAGPPGDLPGAGAAGSPTYCSGQLPRSPRPGGGRQHSIYRSARKTSTSGSSLSGRRRGAG
ncbi:hypothetical protein [Geodermatophilus sp. SYSU D01036]